MTYQTLFDVAQGGYAAWWFPAFGLVFVAAGGALVKWRSRASYRIGLALAALWTITAFVVTYRDYRSAVSKLQNGEYAVVEGPVTGYEALPGKGWGQKAETFLVDGQRFKYHGAVVSAGFHRMASQGGPIRDGLQVRITYSGPDILRLEAAP
jgi:hypothetical protein